MNYLSMLPSSSSLKMNSFGSQDASEDTMKLLQPMSIERLEKNESLDLINSTQLNQDSTFAVLHPKPSSRVEKKVKKIEKDEKPESDFNKFKPKKKIRAKLSFEDDFESIDGLDQESVSTDENISTILARPTKPEPQKVKSQTLTKQVQESKNGRKNKTTQKKVSEVTQNDKTDEIVITNPITIDELSALSSIPKSAMIKSLFLRGISLTANQLVNPTIAQKLGEEFNIKILIKLQESVEPESIEPKNNVPSLPRPPIVTVMGHVDHGKTTLLDKIRKTELAQKELGGITQKIAAYEVNTVHNNQERKIVFLDTPGHEAFSKMRSRGISISDIAVLVVASDDGIRPQTIEAIQQIQESKLPLIVAINKIDKDNANIEGIKKELTKYNIVPEEWGGETLMVPISALQGTNIDKLLETIILLSDVLELKASANSQATGMVLESNLDKTKGAVASLIIKEGTLHVGDIIAVDDNITRIRGMMDASGNSLKEAEPSSAVTIWGLSKLPFIGSKFLSFKDEKRARLFMESTPSQLRSKLNSQLVLSSLDDKSQNKKQINLIIKADSQGSLEAITSNIIKSDHPNVQIRVVQASVGEITETDLEFAFTTKSDILAFNTTYTTVAKKSSKHNSIKVKEFGIIYNLFDHIQSLINEKIGPQYEEKLVGVCSVKNVFPLAKSFVAGTSVLEGKLSKTSFIHVIRDSEIIYKGYISSLKKIKEDVSEVSSGSDCGVFVLDFGTWKPGDIIQAFELVEKKGGTL